MSDLFKPFQLYDFDFSTNPKHPELLHFATREDTFFIRAGVCGRFFVMRNFFTTDRKTIREFDMYCTSNYNIQDNPELNIEPFMRTENTKLETIPQYMCNDCVCTSSEILHEYEISGAERVARIKQGSSQDGKSFFKYQPLL